MFNFCASQGLLGLHYRTASLWAAKARTTPGPPCRITRSHPMSPLFSFRKNSDLKGKSLPWGALCRLSVRPGMAAMVYKGSTLECFRWGRRAKYGETNFSGFFVRATHGGILFTPLVARLEVNYPAGSWDYQVTKLGIAKKMPGKSSIQIFFQMVVNHGWFTMGSTR